MYKMLSQMIFHIGWGEEIQVDFDEDLMLIEYFGVFIRKSNNSSFALFRSLSLSNSLSLFLFGTFHESITISAY